MHAKPILHIARLNAERHGVKVDLARDHQDLLRRAREDSPNLILLGSDLKNPSAEDLRKRMRVDPSTRGVEVLIVDGSLTDIFNFKKALRLPH